MKKTLLIMLFVILIGSLAAQAQGSGQFAGVSQCWNGREFVTVKGNCPTTSSGSGSAGANSAASSAASSAGYQLGYALGSAFGRWLFSSNSNPQAELQKQQMMAELQRRQAEAERQHREEEARRLAAMYNRLATTLKLSGLPNLQLKDVAGSSPGLKLKLGESADGQAGIKGLPGIYLNDGKAPYGIPGLPGIYTGGPGQGSGLTNSKLVLKTGESDPGATSGTGRPSGASTAATNRPEPALSNESGLLLKTGESSAVPPTQAAFDPGKMTPQQLADVAEMVSKLPPEEQQRLLTAARNDSAAGQPAPSRIGEPSPGALPPLQQQASASQAAAAALTLEDASAKARSGFDQPVAQPSAQLGTTGTTPTLLRPAEAVPNPDRLTPPSPVPNDSSSEQAMSGTDDLKTFLFPASPTAAGPFSKDPGPPLMNPLRKEQELQADLKRWDDWAIERAASVGVPPADPLYPLATERAILNTGTIKQYAPELLARYNSDEAFRKNVDEWLLHAAQQVALEYYQLQADAHKAAIVAFQTGLDKLAAEGKIDRLVPFPDQILQHPELAQLLKAMRDRVSADEQAAVEKAQSKGAKRLDTEFQFIFQLIRREATMAPGK